MKNLRKCPKCREEPVLITERDDSDRLDIHMYQCCGVNHNWNATKDDCADDWNYDEDVVDGEIEWLEAELKTVQDDLKMMHGIITERAFKFDALLERSMVRERKIESFECCGTCEQWKYEYEHFACRIPMASNPSGSFSYQRPDHRCDKWEHRR